MNQHKKMKKEPYKYQAVINEIRKLTPCSREDFETAIIDYFIDSRRTEHGILKRNSVKEIAFIVMAKRINLEKMQLYSVAFFD